MNLGADLNIVRQIVTELLSGSQGGNAPDSDRDAVDISGGRADNP